MLIEYYNQFVAKDGNMEEWSNRHEEEKRETEDGIDYGDTKE